MKKIKIKKEFISTIKFIAILVFVYFIVTLSFTYLPFLNKYHTFVIQTNSMEPVIDVGDAILVKEIDVNEIVVGDIIAFYVDINNDGVDEVVVHYIAEINPFEDELIFKTKPEISNEIDSWTIEEDDIVGEYRSQIVGVGNLILFSQSWIGRIIIVLDLVIFSFVYDYLFNKKKKKKEIPDTTDEVTATEIINSDEQDATTEEEINIEGISTQYEETSIRVK